MLTRPCAKPYILRCSMCTCCCAKPCIYFRCSKCLNRPDTIHTHTHTYIHTHVGTWLSRMTSSQATYIKQTGQREHSSSRASAFPTYINYSKPTGQREQSSSRASPFSTYMNYLKQTGQREQSSSRASPFPSPPTAWPRLQGSTGDARVVVYT